MEDPPEALDEDEQYLEEKRSSRYSFDGTRIIDATAKR